MKIKTSELTGAALDWAVAKCEGKNDDCEIHAGNILYGRVTSGFVHYRPSTDWSQGGPIIEREKIATEWSDLWQCWQARDLRHAGFSFSGSTPLIAAMRTFVASKLGDEVDVPEELV